MCLWLRDFYSYYEQHEGNPPLWLNRTTAFEKYYVRNKFLQIYATRIPSSSAKTKFKSRRDESVMLPHTFD